MTLGFTFILILSIQVLTSSTASDKKSKNDITSLETNEVGNFSGPIVSLELEGARINFYNSWQPWSYDRNYYHIREDAHIYTNDNTKYILQGLAAFGFSGKISENRSSSVFNGKEYYHGKRFYPGLKIKDGSTCFYKPKFVYFAYYEDNQPVDGIYFDCAKGKYCSELECFSTTLWWISICVGVPVIIVVIVVIICCQRK